MDVTVVGHYPVKYRHIKPAHGKTFDFTYRPLGPPQQLIHIGTTGCTTSMGICLPIDGARCFAAHINAFVKVPTPQGWDKLEQDILREEAISIENQIFQKLTEVYGWTAEDVVEYSYLTGRNPVIVCAEVFTAETRPAQFVARGVSMFLGIEVCDILGQESEGFVVDHATGLVDYVFSSVKGGMREDSLGRLRRKLWWRNGRLVSGGGRVVKEVIEGSFFGRIRHRYVGCNLTENFYVIAGSTLS